MRKLALAGLLVCAAATALFASAPKTSTILASLMPGEGAVEEQAYRPEQDSSRIRPFDIPAPVPLGDFSSRATLQAPDIALRDEKSADNPSGAPIALRLTTQGSTVYTVAPFSVLATPVDVREGYTILPFRPISNCEKALRWSLEFHSEGSPAAPTGNYHEMDGLGEGPSALRSILTARGDTDGPGRWQYFGVHANDLHAVGAGANLAAVKFVRLVVRGGMPPMIIELGSPYFQHAALQKAKAMITFDDGYASVVDTALPLFKAKGFRGMYNLGAMQETLNAPGRLTVEQLHKLRNAGWQWMQQAYSTEQLAPILAMSETEREAEMRKQIAFAAANRLGDPGFGSYFSQVGQTQVALYGMFAHNQRATRAYFTARAVSAPDFPILYGENYPFIDRYLVRSLAADVPAENFSQLTQHAEQAIANHGVAIYTFHNTLDNLPKLLDWLDANRSRIDVVTEADFFAATHLHPPRP